MIGWDGRTVRKLYEKMAEAEEMVEICILRVSDQPGARRSAWSRAR
jgi:hypothetical protein